MKKNVQLIIWIIVGVVALALVGLLAYNLYLAKTEGVVHPEVSFELENYGTIKMELYPEYAPNTVANILKLAESGFYNDKVLYGKDSLCMYLGRTADGDAPNATVSYVDPLVPEASEENYEYTIKGEFVQNGFNQNTLNHEKGVVTLMRKDYTQIFSSLTEESYDSGCAQLAVIMEESRSLNGRYAAFGKITEGLDILEKIYSEEPIKVEETEDGEEDSSSSLDVFETCPVIKNVTVNTFGCEFNSPEIEEAFDYQSYLSDYYSKYYSSGN